MLTFGTGYGIGSPVEKGARSRDLDLSDSKHYNGLVEHMLQPETCAKKNFKFGGNWVSLKTAGWLYLMLLHDWLLPFVKQSINHALHYDVYSLPIITTLGIRYLCQDHTKYIFTFRM